MASEILPIREATASSLTASIDGSDRDRRRGKVLACQCNPLGDLSNVDLDEPRADVLRSLQMAAGRAGPALPCLVWQPA